MSSPINVIKYLNLSGEPPAAQPAPAPKINFHPDALRELVNTFMAELRFHMGALDPEFFGFDDLLAQRKQALANARIFAETLNRAALQAPKLTPEEEEALITQTMRLEARIDRVAQDVAYAESARTFNR